MIRVKALLTASAILALAACVTINVYFPEAAIKDLSKQIEQEVQRQAAREAAQPGKATPPAQQQAPPAPQAERPRGPNAGAGLFDALFGVTPAYAQAVPQPEVSNPAIRKIIDSRAARVAEINKYKASGVLGENNKGLLEARALDTLPDLKARAEVQRLVKAENTDRDQLYREIAAAKGVDPSQLDKVRETYAVTLRENAKAGEWIQMPDGAWKQKS